MRKGRLGGRVALVTGGTGPTGAVIARRLAEEGAVIAVSTRRGEGADAVAAAVEAAGSRCAVFVGGVADRRTAHEAVAAAVESFGALDILVNNAGAMAGAPFTEIDENGLESVLSANLRTAFWTSQAAIPLMRGRRYGRIVNLSSVAAAGSTGNTDYAAAKAAVEGLTRSLSLETGADGITVNAVSPGLVDHPGTRGRWGEAGQRLLRNASMGVPVEPVDVANAVLFLASDEARRITGQVLTVSAGLEHAPRVPPR